MNSITQQILEEVKILPLALQQETLDFVRFLKHKQTQAATTSNETDEPNGTKLAQLMLEAAEKNLFANIKDPAAWQRKIRQDRPLPGTELEVINPL